MGGELCDLSAVEIRRRVAAGEVRAEAILESCLKRIDALNPDLNAVVTLNPGAGDEARAVDARVARGEDGGLLAGVPVGIKDVTPISLYDVGETTPRKIESALRKLRKAITR